MSRRGFRIPEQLLLPWSPQATISAERTAEMLDCSKATVLRMIESGEITAYQLRKKMGSPFRVNYESVLRFIQSMHKHAGIDPRFDV